jgi:Domain of unknown function (DUF389)
MLHLRVFGDGQVMEEVATSVSALPGADHIIRSDAGDRSAAGLTIAGVVAGVLAALLNVLDLLPSSFHVGENGLAGLTTINSSTVVVALAAGIAGMLAIETRASAAVGVAISVTTIPASAYLGVAAGMGAIGKASGALAVLATNVAMLLVGGSLTLVVQRAVARGDGAPAR